jgi:hypothetical protein
MDSIATDLQTNLARQPGVVRADVVYQDNITAPGTAAVRIGLRPGTELEPVVDDAVRLVWQSRLEPLHHIRVDAVYDNSDQRGTTRSVDPIKDKAQLEAEYGPRPK